VRVHVGGLAGAPVAQRLIDLLEGGLVVFAIHLEGDGGVFLQVDMVEGDGAGVAVGGRGLQRFGAQNDGQGGCTTTKPGPEGLQQRRIRARATDRH
jgi:hypothetical protein